MAFERFTLTKCRIKYPVISIYPRYQILFNSAATSQFCLSSFKYVVLFYDTSSSRIGFKFTNETEDGGHKINKHQKACLISCKAFIRNFKLQNKKTIHRTICFDKTSGLFVA